MVERAFCEDFSLWRSESGSSVDDESIKRLMVVMSTYMHFLRWGYHDKNVE